MGLEKTMSFKKAQKIDFFELAWCLLLILSNLSQCYHRNAAVQEAALSNVKNAARSWPRLKKSHTHTPNGNVRRPSSEEVLQRLHNSSGDHAWTVLVVVFFLPLLPVNNAFLFQNGSEGVNGRGEETLGESPISHMSKQRIPPFLPKFDAPFHGQFHAGAGC